MYYFENTVNSVLTFFLIGAFAQRLVEKRLDVLSELSITPPNTMLEGEINHKHFIQNN